MINYWLMKSEPTCFSIDDLQHKQQEAWDGVRNYQARNMMRDQMTIGDEVFFYHSNCPTPGIAGLATIASAAYPDPTQFDPNSQYFDGKATTDKPIWYLVDVQFKQKFAQVIALDRLRQHPGLEDMWLLRKGSRLSITPVTFEQWHLILTMAP